MSDEKVKMREMTPDEKDRVVADATVLDPKVREALKGHTVHAVFAVMTAIAGESIAQMTEGTTENLQDIAEHAVSNMARAFNLEVEYLKKYREQQAEEAERAQTDPAIDPSELN